MSAKRRFNAGRSMLPPESSHLPRPYLDSIPLVDVCPSLLSAYRPRGRSCAASGQEPLQCLRRDTEPRSHGSVAYVRRQQLPGANPADHFFGRYAQLAGDFTWGHPSSVCHRNLWCARSVSRSLSIASIRVSAHEVLVDCSPASRTLDECVSRCHSAPHGARDYRHALRSREGWIQDQDTFRRGRRISTRHSITRFASRGLRVLQDIQAKTPARHASTRGRQRL